MPDSSTGHGQPLLSIAIPTFNRAACLAQLLDCLAPQIAALPAGQIELLVSDNASTDATPDVIANCLQRGLPIRSIRQPQNIGADANFAACYANARGTFFWLCGDDDLIVPGALTEVVDLLKTSAGEPAEVDLIYATSSGFRKDSLAERGSDPLGRTLHTHTDAHTFATVVNIMFTFISGIIVNKERLDSLPHEDPAAFIGTNLVQLSWALPLLLHHRRSLVLWTRPVAGRVGQAHGYSLGEVFGKNLSANVLRLLPNRPDLSGPILNFAIRRWFPSMLLEVRTSGNRTLGIDEVHTHLREVFGRNPRYWIFTYPVLKLPLPAARLYFKISVAFNKVLYMALLPGFWRKRT